MSGRAARWFWGIVAAQALFLLVWAGWHAVLRTHAPVVRLRTEPVDPRDPVRGDFMQLRYAIARVAPAEVEKIPVGSPVWVALERRHGFDEAVAVFTTEPDPSPGRTIVRATRGWSGLEFGIERYYVPEGKGTPTFKSIVVEAAVGPGGRLYLRRLLLDGREYP
jgi:uncharacterized membrane-anchored protein